MLPNTRVSRITLGLGMVPIRGSTAYAPTSSDPNVLSIVPVPAKLSQTKPLLNLISRTP